MSNITGPVVNDHGAPSGSPAVAFVIGVSIVLLASILNAGGLNLTKLDHVRTSAIPKASRRKDWLRPLWLLGMILYILSQLIGSTLALRYLRAEYVAPLGATSLIFNFLFASLLVGTPVTNTDIYGTIVVILGVVGIVAFGSINSGLEMGMDLELLKTLWARGQWLMLFAVMTTALTLVYIFAAQLDRVLAARADISAVPFAAQLNRQEGRVLLPQTPWWKRVVVRWQDMMGWVAERLETWTAAKDDKTLAWTLGIAWACCGGGLAGGCLVFARTSVQLLSYASTQPHPGSQFAHIAPVATFIFLAVTAVFQIICLNRGLRVFDSTLVVPVFYGVYTGTGALDSLIFNAEVEKYHTWTLILIFLSIMILVSGVVLLTHKKPEPGSGPRGTGHVPLGAIPASRKAKGGANADIEDASPHESEALHNEGDNSPVVWEVGAASDDEEDDATVHEAEQSPKDGRPAKTGLAGSMPGEEGRGLIRHGEEDHDAEDW
ncbi:uncharacterized protein FOMMEDRAFT_84763 [Fomitiporia mediterranea MF3/22]|uniref:uncharacterized protein n=1 Tax=Fomitiporia mediterranea (strain MF3/22) TaxID=694068 RepID=UPI0004408D20|nr:uncharacterized protein FOMMEDRAFT_84763 [Fomitiporia mediterranea MF3/22]EJD03300.1 hypothetical protein FOMMEDRAFT_84763 [Fomitiporia mediterranea MF3/22]